MKNVEEYALGFLKDGRADWDIPHTKAVVYYAQTISSAEKLDPSVLVAAAWLHDIGYSDLLSLEGLSSYDVVKDKKQEHMIRGVELSRRFFTLEFEKKNSTYTTLQAERICHLVGVHDKLINLRDLDEIVLMEADTLGAIDLSRVTPTFNKEDGIRYIDGLKKKRLPKFSTTMGKSHLYGLLPKFEEYFAQM